VNKLKAQKSLKAVTKGLVVLGYFPPFAKKDTELERKLANRLGRMFTGVQKELIQQLEEWGVQSSSARRRIVENALARMDDFDDVLIGEWKSLAEDGRRSALMELRRAGVSIPDKAFQITDEVKRQIERRVGPIVERTLERMTDDFLSVLQQGYEDGLGIDEIADNLRREAKQVRDYRLERVARTEVNSAQNWGKEQALREFAEYKQWLTADDERVRGVDPDSEFDHVEMHGQVVRVDENFRHPTQGWELKHPGDRAGEPGNVINCRCTERAYIPSKEDRQKRTPFYPI